MSWHPICGLTGLKELRNAAITRSRALLKGIAAWFSLSIVVRSLSRSCLVIVAQSEILYGIADVRVFRCISKFS